jgi:hypothetical protein
MGRVGEFSAHKVSAEKPSFLHGLMLLSRIALPHRSGHYPIINYQLSIIHPSIPQYLISIPNVIPWTQKSVVASRRVGRSPTSRGATVVSIA